MSLQPRSTDATTATRPTAATAAAPASIALPGAYGPRTARLVLAGLAVLAALGVSLAVTTGEYREVIERRGRPGDIALYVAQAARMQAGEAYYDAAAVELRARGYPTRSLFNWRTPLPVWLIARLSPRVAQGLLCGLALLLVMQAFALLEREGTLGEALGGTCLLVGALLPCGLGELFVMPVVWAGVLMALSAVLLARGQRKAGIAAGLAALFVRELAGLYCLVAASLAWRDGRRGEVLAWLAGFTLYGAFFLWHAQQVALRIGPDEMAHQAGWLQGGGLRFVIGTCRMNAFLLVLPLAASALYFVAAVIGMASWNTAAGRQVVLPLAAYLALFAVAGQPFNQYWGSLIAPLLCLVVARAPAALRGWWLAARGARVGESSRDVKGCEAVG